MSHALWPAAEDVLLPATHNAVFVTSAPDRWDEYLDLDCPLFVGSQCGQLSTLVEALIQAGASARLTARVVEQDGLVWTLDWESPALPKAENWTLVLGWTHPQEGWRARRPLYGQRYLVTRQKQQGGPLVEELRSLGARVLAVPTIEFQPPDCEVAVQDALAHLTEFDWLLFTSPNGVRHFFSYLRAANLDHRALARASFACIGPGTEKSLNQEGFNADLVPPRFVAEGLLEALAQRLGQDLTGLKFLIPRAQEAREVLPETLRSAGGQVVVAPVYKTVLPQPPAEFGNFVTPQTRLLFTSSSTVKNWVERTQNLELPCYCIGPVTATTARERGLQVLGVAERHTIDGLVACVLENDRASIS